MLAYAITDPSTLSFDSLCEDLRRFSVQADWIVYRDKHTRHYLRNALAFLNAASGEGFARRLLHGDVTAAYELGADGVHLRSDQLDEIARAKSLDLFVIASTHTLPEARKAQAAGADAVTFGPVFATPGKGAPVGVDALQATTEALSIPVIALGGILSQAQIEACEKSGAAGYASIRYFG